ncbi:MAG: hypothetical protein KDI90_10405 [Alphaproteobacteria bacterium]|nr:hypothetical protein [Alphaproteobacteria bacterium]MCB9974333.1 hypothetical protein [Rhodospirillales bacterium]
MPIWELWLEEYEEIVEGKVVKGEGYHFFQANCEHYEKNVRRCGENAKRIWTTEALDYNDAHTKYHAYMGWEEYKPME